MFISIMGYFGLGFERERDRRLCFQRKGFRIGGKLTGEIYVEELQQTLSFCLLSVARNRKGRTGYGGSTRA